MMNSTTINRQFLVRLSNMIKDSGLTAQALNEAMDALKARAAELNKPGWLEYAMKFQAWVNSQAWGELPFAVLALGNAKLPFLAYSTLPGINCPGAGTCWLFGLGFCYSVKAWRYPGGYLRQLQNTVLEAGPAGQAIIRAAIKEKLKEAEFTGRENIPFRLYVDGDFSSLAVLRFWMDTLKQFPQLQAYNYSKSLHLFQELDKTGFNWPENFVLNGSAGSIYDKTKTAAYVSKLAFFRGPFVPAQTSKATLKAWRQRKKGQLDKLPRSAGQEIRAQFPGEKVFICPGNCGACTAAGHACGDNTRFHDIKIVIPAH